MLKQVHDEKWCIRSTLRRSTWLDTCHAKKGLLFSRKSEKRREKKRERERLKICENSRLLVSEANVSNAFFLEKKRTHRLGIFTYDAETVIPVAPSGGLSLCHPELVSGSWFWSYPKNQTMKLRFRSQNRDSLTSCPAIKGRRAFWRSWSRLLPESSLLPLIS